MREKKNPEAGGPYNLLMFQELRISPFLGRMGAPDSSEIKEVLQ